MTKMQRELDPGIREVVMLLRQAGFDTFSSCQGGRGHVFREPTVLMYPATRNPDAERKKLAKAVLKAGWTGGFYTFVRYQHASNVADAAAILCLEFWSKECLQHCRKKAKP